MSPLPQSPLCSKVSKSVETQSGFAACCRLATKNALFFVLAKGEGLGFALNEKRLCVRFASGRAALPHSRQQSRGLCSHSLILIWTNLVFCRLACP
jgi:hypothetical protein